MNAQVEMILRQLAEMGNTKGVDGMARVGIKTERAYGVRVPDIRKYARTIPKDHQLALALWETGIHEARHLAAMIDDPAEVTEAQMEKWVADIDSWDLCDLVTGDLFGESPLAKRKIEEWAGREEEFVKRASFAMIAWAAVHWKQASDEEIAAFFPLIVRESTDPRNFVRKAVNWALRNIGKRSLTLNTKAVEVARQIGASEDKTARWIAADALRELTSEKVIARLEKKTGLSPEH